MSEKRVYLGDGAYAGWDGQELTVFTSDGINRKNEVVLDEVAVRVLLNFLAENAIL